MRISDWSSDVCSSDLSTRLENSIFQTKAPDHFFDGNILRRIIVRQGGFEQRDVLEFVDIFFDRLSRECGLGAARFLRGGGQPRFEFLVEQNGTHGGDPALNMVSEGGFAASTACLRGAKVTGT